jgi:hypothetical protein
MASIKTFASHAVLVHFASLVVITPSLVAPFTLKSSGIPANTDVQIVNKIAEASIIIVLSICVGELIMYSP